MPPKTKAEIKKSKQFFKKLEDKMKMIKKENKSPKSISVSPVLDNNGLDGKYFLNF